MRLFNIDLWRLSIDCTFSPRTWGICLYFFEGFEVQLGPVNLLFFTKEPPLKLLPSNYDDEMPWGEYSPDEDWKDTKPKKNAKKKSKSNKRKA